MSSPELAQNRTGDMRMQAAIVFLNTDFMPPRPATDRPHANILRALRSTGTQARLFSFPRRLVRRQIAQR